MIFWVYLGLALALARSAAADTVQAFNLTLDDQSPAITYLPSRSGLASQTWNVSYTSSNWSTYTSGQIGQGASSHYTTSVGASASVSWTGTAIYIVGTGGSGNYQVILDGNNQSSNAGGGMLAALDGLEYGKHNLTLLVTGTGGVRLTRIKLGLNMGNSGNVQNSTWSNGANFNPSFDTSVGQWEAATQLGNPAPAAGPGAPAAGAGNTGTETYDRIDTHTPGSILSLQPPLGTSLVVLYGAVNYDHGPYTVSMSSKAGNVSSLYTGLSPWADTNQVNYYGVLRPDQQYLVQVQFQGKATQYWDIAQAVFISAAGGTAASGASSLNVPAIVGGVLGGAAALVIALGCLWLVIRKRRRASTVKEVSARPETNGTFHIDEPYKEEALPGDPTTYYHDPQMAYANAAAGAPSAYPNPGAVRITPLFIPAYVHTAATEPSEYLAESQPRNSTSSPPTTPFADGALSRRDSDPANSSPRRAGSRSNNATTGHQPFAAGAGEGSEAMHAAERKARMYEEDRRRSMRAETEDEYRSEHEVVQEQDAGRVTVPPTYDPSWADPRLTHEARLPSPSGQPTHYDR